MSRRKTSAQASFGKGITSHSATAGTTAPAPRPTPTPPNEAPLQRKYRKLIRKHLGKILDKLFSEITGLHFHVAWAPASPHKWDTRTLPTACSVCCQLSGSPLLRECQICGPRQLARALSGDGEGHHFTCPLGVRNYWVPIRIRDETLGIAYLQALDHPTARHPDRRHSARAVQFHGRRADAKMMSRMKFARAARFLQHIIQHVQTSSLSDLRKADLTSARHAVLALEKEQTRLHEALKRHLSVAPETSHRATPESHPQQLVHHLLERLKLDYAKPITLQRCAAQLGMNASYVSALFSRAVGIPFKAYLTEMRLEKAKAMLSDPAKPASEVAYAVGYATENRFRLAFKKATGLSPKLWRETMQTNPPPPHFVAADVSPLVIFWKGPEPTHVGLPQFTKRTSSALFGFFSGKIQTNDEFSKLSHPMQNATWC